ncbi:MAG: hypothetical protein KUL80_06125 [Comamonas sp.]|nr:hypothetical protein [Comamonas sp.]
MPREILSAAPETTAPSAPLGPSPAQQSAVPRQPQQPQQPQQPPAPPASRDVLAGALPAWDLLPAAPFVRRSR